MGVVTDAVRGVVRRQLDEHGVVVWFDPDQQYASVPPTLGDGVQVVARHQAAAHDELLHGLADTPRQRVAGDGALTLRQAALLPPKLEPGCGPLSVVAERVRFTCRAPGRAA